MITENMHLQRNVCMGKSWLHKRLSSERITKRLRAKDDGTLTSQKSRFYGHWYLALIPIFSIYYFIEFSFYRCNIENYAAWELIGRTLIDSIYFSVITITTLGYGDITPLTIGGKLVAASESLCGISLIGLFLNALSHQHSEEAQSKERKEMLSHATGGDSYPIMVLSRHGEEGRQWSFQVKSIGEYPLYELEYEIYYIYGFETCKNKDSSIKYIYKDNLGVFVPGRKSPDRLFTILETDYISVVIVYSASNGRFFQHIEFKQSSSGNWFSSDWLDAHWYDRNIKNKQIIIKRDDDLPEGIRW